MRVVAVMNFYTESCPESTRPPELNRHLFGDRRVSALGRRISGRVPVMADVPLMVALPRTVSAVVEDGGLALGYASGRVVQAEAQVVARPARRCRGGPRRGRGAGPGSRRGSAGGGSRSRPGGWR